MFNFVQAEKELHSLGFDKVQFGTSGLFDISGKFNNRRRRLSLPPYFKFYLTNKKFFDTYVHPQIKQWMKDPPGCSHPKIHASSKPSPDSINWTCIACRDNK